jgi:hypothetical protein
MPSTNPNRTLCRRCGAWYLISGVHVCEPEHVQAYSQFKLVEQIEQPQPSKNYKKQGAAGRISNVNRARQEELRAKLYE